MSPAGLKVGRGVPTAPSEIVQFRTVWAPTDIRGAVGTPRPTHEWVGQPALAPAQRGRNPGDSRTEVWIVPLLFLYWCSIVPLLVRYWRRRAEGRPFKSAANSRVRQSSSIGAKAQALNAHNWFSQPFICCTTRMKILEPARGIW